MIYLQWFIYILMYDCIWGQFFKVVRGIAVIGGVQGGLGYVLVVLVIFLFFWGLWVLYIQLESLRFSLEGREYNSYIMVYFFIL